MKILISKSRGAMDVLFTIPGSDTKLAFSQSVTVVTNVVQNEQGPGSSTKSDTSRRQSNGTNPTQVANGEYAITDARAPSPAVNKNGKYGKGNQGLLINFSQILAVFGSDEKPTGKQARDSGYMVHITPNTFTDGCVGIPYDSNNPDSKKDAEAIMDRLVEIFKATMSENGDKKATIQFVD